MDKRGRKGGEKNVLPCNRRKKGGGKAETRFAGLRKKNGTAKTPISPGRLGLCEQRGRREALGIRIWGRGESGEGGKGLRASRSVKGYNTPVISK